MNALALTFLVAIPALMLLVGESVKRLVIGRRLARRRPAPVAVPVREAPAADAAGTRVA